MDDRVARRAHELLQRALECDAPERPAFLAAASAGDPDLQARLPQLLAAVRQSQQFLETSALDNALDYQRHNAMPPLREAQSIGNYRITRVIGVGGMATVYEAVQSQPQRRVALKVPRQAWGNAEAIDRFRYETEFLGRLQHPGIAQIYEAGTWDLGDGMRTPFFAMEFISEARSIIDFARAEALPLRDRLRMFADVCDAVHYGHQRGVLHRDLKPHNILVDAAGIAKVIDFGVACSVDPNQTWMTQVQSLSEIVGTLNYMSPEQCTAGKALDVRSDVYSLGVVLYELLCGCLPHELSNIPIPEALRLIQSESPPRPASIDPRLRGDLDAIILKAIEKNPERRYNSVDALAEDVRRHLQHQTVTARAPTVLYQCRAFAQRNRVLVSSGAAVLLAVILGAALSVGFAYQTWRESQRRLAAETKAIQERDAAVWQAYIANIAGAFSAWDSQEYRLLRNRLALASSSHRGWEWHFLNGIADSSEQKFTVHDDMVFGVAFQPAGTHFATASRDGTVRIWDSLSAEPLLQLDGTAPRPVYSLAFTADGKKLLGGSDDGSVRVWETSTGAELRKLDHHSAVLSVTCGRGSLVGSASRNGVAQLWDCDTGAIVRNLTDGSERVHGVAFSRDGTLLLAWNINGDVWLRTGNADEVIHRWQFAGTLELAAISDDKRWVAAAGDDGQVTIWDASTGEMVADTSIPSSSASVKSLAFSSDGTTLAAGQIDRGITLFAVPDVTENHTIYGHEETVSGLWFAPDGERLFSVSWDRTLRVWRLYDQQQQAMRRLVGHDDEVLGVAISPDGTLIASASRDNTIGLWDPELSQPVGRLRGHRSSVFAVAFSPDGTRLASASSDKTVRLWDPLTGELLTVLTEHTAPIWSVAFSSDGTRLVTSGDDQTIRIWNAATGELQRTVTGHKARVTQVAFSPDGSQIASSSRDQTVGLWNAESGERLYELMGHRSDVFSVVFSHDGKRLYSGCRDQTVRAWDVQSGACLHVLGGHGQFVTSLSLTGDGTRLAAGSWFGEVLLWDLPTHELVASFRAHLRAIRAVSFSPDGRFLVTGSLDKSLLLYDAATPRRAARRMWRHLLTETTQRHSSRLLTRRTQRPPKCCRPSTRSRRSISGHESGPAN